MSNNRNPAEIQRIAREYLKSKLDHDMEQREASSHRPIYNVYSQPGCSSAGDLEWVEAELQTAKTELRERLYDHQRPLIDEIMEAHSLAPELRNALAHAVFRARRRDGVTEGWTGNEGQPFPSYARLLPARGTPGAESRYSWTIDFAIRRKQAREEMKPHIAEAERAKSEVVSLKEKLKAAKAVNPRNAVIEILETKIQEQEKAVRDAQAKADALDATVFDLKAVNPNAVIKIDKRTPEEVIQSIASQAEIVEQTLKALTTLLQT